MQAIPRSLMRLPLQRDLDADFCTRLESSARVCSQLFASGNYQRVDTPIMENTELFLRKSGGELASRLYSFTDPGGYAVSLRPEFTAPVIRHILEEVGLDKLPLRFQYSGPVFRYPDLDSKAADKLGTFTQVGAELIGIPGPDGDAEIVEMALRGLVEIGISYPTIQLGHVGLLWDLLKPYELSERARFFLIKNVGALVNGKRVEVRDEAVYTGLVPQSDDTPEPRLKSIVGEGSALAESLLGFGLGISNAGSTGVRQPKEIATRLAAKLSEVEDPGSFDSAVDALIELCSVNGAPSIALPQSRNALSKAGSKSSTLDSLERVVEIMVSGGVSEDAISIDLGLVRGIAYYTGTVFDLGADGKSLGGGGRYDGLVRALGGNRNVPALGFAYNLEAAIEVANRGG